MDMETCFSGMFCNQRTVEYEKTIKQFECLLKSLELQTFKFFTCCHEVYYLNPIVDKPSLLVPLIDLEVWNAQDDLIAEDFSRILAEKYKEFNIEHIYFFYKEDDESLVSDCYWTDGRGFDRPYVFCVCTDCGYIGIEFDGRSDRLGCKGDGGCKYSAHGDKGYTAGLLEKAYRKAGLQCPTL